MLVLFLVSTGKKLDLVLLSDGTSVCLVFVLVPISFVGLDPGLVLVHCMDLFNISVS